MNIRIYVHVLLDCLNPNRNPNICLSVLLVKGVQVAEAAVSFTSDLLEALVRVPNGCQTAPFSHCHPQSLRLPVVWSSNVQGAISTDIGRS